MHIMKKQVLLIILLALPLWLKAADVSVTGLRTEQMVDPMGLDTAVPRMSWRLESSQRNVMQTAYRILVASSPELLAQDKGDLWDSGKVESDASVWIPYQGKRLKSNQRVYWKVRSYTNRGETEWSEPARWGMGPLKHIFVPVSGKTDPAVNDIGAFLTDSFIPSAHLSCLPSHPGLRLPLLLKHGSHPYTGPRSHNPP